MSVTRQRKLSFEVLERRDCPAVTANVIAGNLNITAWNSTSLAILQLDADSYQITENGTNVITRDGVTGSLCVKSLGWNGANVSIDFAGFGTVKNVSNTFLTLGTNTLSIVDGTITGNLCVFGGLRADSVTLGDGELGLTVNGSTSVNLFTGKDSLTANGDVDLKGNVCTTLIETVTLGDGSLLEKNATFFAGLGGNTYNLNGAVTGNVWYTGGLGTDSFNTGATSTIGGDLSVYLLSGTDNVNLNAGSSVTGTVRIGSALFFGNKTINLDGAIGNNAIVNLGFGNDTVNFTGTITNTFTLNTGFGQDNVTFSDTSTVATANVNLGPGNDTFTLGAAATVGAGTINGGLGLVDTFNGTAAASFPNLTVINFEVLNP